MEHATTTHNFNDCATINGYAVLDTEPIFAASRLLPKLDAAGIIYRVISIYNGLSIVFYKAEPCVQRNCIGDIAMHTGRKLWEGIGDIIPDDAWSIHKFDTDEEIVSRVLEAMNKS